MRIRNCFISAAFALCPLMQAFAAAGVQPKVEYQAQPFALTEIRLLEGPFRDAMLRDKEYLLRLEPDRLLHMFRVTAGLPSSAEPYGGWEEPKCELRGHSTGHYLTACALMYASTGDEKLKANANAIVAELARCQEALPSKGYNQGFLSAYPETFFDRVDRREPVWAPYYTLHKIMAGLLDAYQLCGNQQALDVLVKMADWLKARVDRLSTEQMQKALGNEHGGMNEVFANLYAVTGNPDYLRMAKAFNHRAIFDPLARGEDKLNGLHANTQIPKVIGAAREYELSGEKEFRDVAVNFWRNVALQRSYCIGGHSENEHFFPVETFSKHLGPSTAETCNTYNMLKLTRHLFEWEPAAETMDFYERALFNQILGSEDPRTGMVMYFASLKPGHVKTYGTPDKSFWCCTGTGMENHAKYGDTIYFRSGDSLFVNLFIASELNWKEKGLAVRQETKFPDRDTTRLTLRCARPTELALRVRWPSWARELSVKVNGKKTRLEGSPGSYVTVKREWQDGDRVDIKAPMSLHLWPMPDNPNVTAVLYGPIVLVGKLGTEGLEKISPYARNQGDQFRLPTPEVPSLVCDLRELPAHIKRVSAEPLTFRTRGVGRPKDVTLIPYYRLHHERFAVYWPVMTETAWKEKRAVKSAEETKRKALEARIVDEVRPGEQQPEIDHAFKGENTQAGDFNNRKWRHAGNGGWFSYELKVLPNQPTLLRCTYWGSDAGNREFVILVNGETVATQKLENNQPDAFFTVDYPIPARSAEGKDRVTVKFQALPGKIAGGVFGITVLKN